MDSLYEILAPVRWNGLFTGTLLVLGAFLFATRIIDPVVEHVGERSTSLRLRAQQVGSGVRFFLYLTSFLILLDLSVELSTEFLLATGGVVAVSLGFGLKDLASSVVAGLLIFFDRPFQVGDRIKFRDIYGEVNSIGLRSVRIVTLDDSLVTIPNSLFLTEAVSSANAGAPYMMVEVDFHIAPDQDLAAAKSVVADAVLASRYTYQGKPWAVLSSQMVSAETVMLRLRAKVYVLDIEFEKALQSEVTERVMVGFRDKGIKAPGRSLGQA